MDAKLHVGNVAPTTTAQSLRKLFSRAGTVTAIKLLGDNDGPQSKNYAYVTMVTPAAAQRAIDQFHATELDGSQLAVSIAQPLNVPGEYQSRLNAFGPSRGTATVNTPKRSKPRTAYQNSLSAFGGGKSAPIPPRRRGGQQRKPGG